MRVYVWYTIPSSRAKTFQPGASAIPCARSVPTFSAQSWSHSGASATIFAGSPVAICSSVSAKSKSKLKSLPYDDTYGNCQPMRRL